MYDHEIIDRDIKFDNYVLQLEEKVKVREMMSKHKKALSLHSEVRNTNVTVYFCLNDTSA